MKRAFIKLIWYLQGISALLCIVGSIWSGYYAFRMLSTTGTFWEVFNQVYTPAIPSLLLALVICIGSFFCWKPIPFLNIFLMNTIIKDVVSYIQHYDRDHTAYLDHYGKISITFGSLGTANAIEVFSALAMLFCGLVLMMIYVYRYFSKKNNAPCL